ncbi:MAG: hypothetical protein NTU61_00650 [Candidatus Altiarchaeota archaeon]|nr:hypothetical protein [Candidatus Altiarchaeota archaeon]
MRIIVAALLSLLVILPTSLAADSDWPMFQHDAAHSGRNPSNSSLNLTSFGELWVWETTGDVVYAPPVTYDINSDGNLELILATANGFVYAISADGRTLWYYNSSISVVASPAAFTSGGIAYIVFSSKDYVHLHDSTGGEVWSKKTAQDFQLTPPQLEDINKDGVQEIIFDNLTITLKGEFREYGKEDLLDLGVAPPTSSIAEGNERMVYPGNLFMVPAVADVNGDGTLEVIDVLSKDYDPHLTLKSLEGIIIWISNVTIKSPPAVADLDGDGRTEITACSGDGTAIIVDSEGNMLQDLKSRNCRYTIISDLSQDGTLEVIASFKDGSIRAYGSVVDSDGDGLTDFREDVLGTDKYSEDTDGDSLEDAIDPEPLKARSFRELRQESVDVKQYLTIIILIIAFVYVSKSAMNYSKGDAAWRYVEEKIELTRKDIKDLTETRETAIKRIGESKKEMEKEWDKILYG